MYTAVVKALDEVKKTHAAYVEANTKYEESRINMHESRNNASIAIINTYIGANSNYDESSRITTMMFIDANNGNQEIYRNFHCMLTDVTALYTIIINDNNCDFSFENTIVDKFDEYMCQLTYFAVQIAKSCNTKEFNAYQDSINAYQEAMNNVCNAIDANTAAIANFRVIFKSFVNFCNVFKSICPIIFDTNIKNIEMLVQHLNETSSEDTYNQLFMYINEMRCIFSLFFELRTDELDDVACDTFDETMYIPTNLLENAV